MEHMTDILWWVQMADCTTFENWKVMRESFVNFPFPNAAAVGYTWPGSMPSSISIVGSGAPMDVQDLFLLWGLNIVGNEYMIFVEMQRTDVLSRHALTYHVMTANDIVAVKGLDAARYILASVTDWDGTS